MNNTSSALLPGVAGRIMATPRQPAPVVFFATLMLLPIGAWWAARGAPPWGTMWAIAFAEFLGVKLLTLSRLWRPAPAWRVAAYIALWPGMDAPAFLGVRLGKKVPPASILEWTFAFAKLASGLAAIGWAVAHANTAEPMIVGWVGMLGLIFSLHFGLFHLVSLAWRAVGVAAAPIMRAPILAESLADFWGERWNAAFAAAARQILLRPLARRYGGAKAGAVVFLVSGLVHESVISVPARAGWGGPFLYFAIQAAGAWFEKSAIGRALRLGQGARGRMWTMLVTLAPVPLLFHPAFVTKVMTPFFSTLAALIP